MGGPTMESPAHHTGSTTVRMDRDLIAQGARHKLAEYKHQEAEAECEQTTELTPTFHG